MLPQDFPPSPVLTLAGLEPPVRREDLDGDNWPVTWADDNALYAAYGDGWGCRPLHPETKYNTGLVRMPGAPTAPEAEEVPCPWYGAGAQDPNIKGCGLLSAGGVLYHFLRYQAARPGGGSRRQIASLLTWSADHGATWQGATSYADDPQRLPWFFQEPDRAFHSPTFLQAGRDYGDAPDDFAYLYTPDEDRRLANDHLALARVPVASIPDRSAYRFFAGVGGDGRPLWDHRPEQRVPVLTCPGHVGCGDVVYLPALQRYLLATAGGDGAGPSSLLLLEGPAPWGPWHLVGHVAEWGTGRDGDHRYDPRLPAKWIAPDASSCVLVYSDRRPSDKLNWQRLRLDVRPARASRHMSGTARLHAFADAVMQHQTEALLVQVGGRTVVERYAAEWGPARPHYTASLAKTLVGAMGLVLAWGDGRIAPEDPACRHVAAWTDDPRRAVITVGQLAAHTAGIEDAEEGGLPHDRLTGWRGRFWQRGGDPFRIARDEAGLAADPGTRFLYSNPGNAMLGYCITASLRGAPAPDLHRLLRDRLLRPLGVSDSEWGIGSPSALDGLALHPTWGSGAFSAAATAAIGRLLLAGGHWAGRDVLDPERVRQLLAEAGTPLPRPETDGPRHPANGLAIWLNRNGAWPSLPADAFAGAGAGHQLLLVVPSRDLVLVRYGARLEPGDFWEPMYRHILAPLGDASG